MTAPERVPFLGAKKSGTAEVFKAYGFNAFVSLRYFADNREMKAFFVVTPI